MLAAILSKDFVDDAVNACERPRILARLGLAEQVPVDYFGHYERVAVLSEFCVAPVAPPIVYARPIRQNSAAQRIDQLQSRKT